MYENLLCNKGDISNQKGLIIHEMAVSLETEYISYVILHTKINFSEIIYGNK